MGMKEQSPSWYALRTFNCQEQKVSHFLSSRECNHFIPMKIVLSKPKDNESPKQILEPAIHNILFIQKNGTQQEMIELVSTCPGPVRIFRYPGVEEFCEISNSEMMELRMFCDPQFQDTSEFMTQDEAENMVGKNVLVTKGPFKGSVGRLVRRQKQYYFLKIVTGMGVMVRISRWYCEPI